MVERGTWKEERDRERERERERDSWADETSLVPTAPLFYCSTILLLYYSTENSRII